MKSIWPRMLAFCLLLTSCNSVEFNIIRTIENTCDFSRSDPQECYINLAETIPFEWDEVFDFEDSFSVNAINQAIGFDCNCKAVNYERHRIVFIKDQEIAEEMERDQFHFRFNFALPLDDDDGVPNFRYDSSVFRVKKMAQRGHYTLEHSPSR